jgi:hypothetical protein
VYGLVYQLIEAEAAIVVAIFLHDIEPESSNRAEFDEDRMFEGFERSISRRFGKQYSKGRICKACKYNFQRDLGESLAQTKDLIEYSWICRM